MVVCCVGDECLVVWVEVVVVRIFELSELLVDVLGVMDVGALFLYRVIYYFMCYLLRMLCVGERFL